MRRRRYGPVGSHYNSKKYLAMHNRNISVGLSRYWFARKAREAYKNGTATPEQIAFVKNEMKAQLIAFLIICAALILWALIK